MLYVLHHYKMCLCLRSYTDLNYLFTSLDDKQIANTLQSVHGQTRGPTYIQSDMHVSHILTELRTCRGVQLALSVQYGGYRKSKVQSSAINNSCWANYCTLLFFHEYETGKMRFAINLSCLILGCNNKLTELPPITAKLTCKI